MLVHEVMSTSVVSVREGTSIHDALRLLDEHKITSLPVLDAHEHAVGVVSEADLVRELVPADQRSQMRPVTTPSSPPAKIVGEVMTAHPITVGADDDLAVAVDLLISTSVKSVPVVTRGRVVGMLSRRDVVHLMARADDRIVAEISELFRSDGLDWLVDVRDGAVTVTGPASDPEERLAIALAGSVAGVSAVRIA